MTTSSGSLIARAVVSQVLARAFGTALSFFTLALTVRYLGASDYGVLVTAVVFVGLFEALAELGVGTAVVRRVASGSDTLERLVGLSLGMSTLYALPVAGLALGIGHLLYGGQPETWLGVAILSGGLICSVLSTCYEPVCNVTVRFGALSLTDVLSRSLSLAGVLVVVAADLGLPAVFVVNTLPPVVRLVVLATWARRHGRYRPVYALRPSLGLLREGLPFAFIIAVGVLYFRVDGLMLSVFSDPVQVGAYGLAYRIVANATVVPNVLAEAAFSTLAKTWNEGRQRFRDAAGRALEAVVVFAVPLGVFGVLLAEPLVRLVAADEYTTEAASSLQLLAVATALASVNRIQSQALASAHQQAFLVRLSIFSLLLNVAANLVLIPELGAPGAATALVVTEVVSVLVAGTRLAGRAGALLHLRFLIRLALATGVALVAFVAVRDLPVLAVGAIVCVAYVAGLAAFQPVGVRDVRAVLRR